MVKIRDEFYPSQRPQTDPNAWWHILGVPRTATVDQIKAAHRNLIKIVHSDMGGNDEVAARVNVARDEGIRERQSRSPWIRELP